VDGHTCPTAHRKLPIPGDRVWFVSACFAEPVAATVTDVAMRDMEDLNVWRWRTDPATGQPVPVLDHEGGPVLVEWPNPNVSMLDDTGATQVTRQVRYLGSPGWAWPLGSEGMVARGV
jgi:hypothetical protein